jgi:hypothetical protein
VRVGDFLVPLERQGTRDAIGMGQSRLGRGHHLERVAIGTPGVGLVTECKRLETGSAIGIVLELEVVGPPW